MPRQITLARLTSHLSNPDNTNETLILNHVSGQMLLFKERAAALFQIYCRDDLTLGEVEKAAPILFAKLAGKLALPQRFISKLFENVLLLCVMLLYSYPIGCLKDASSRR